MPRKASGTEKEYEVKVKQPNGDTYVYKRRVVYDPVKKTNRVLDSKLTGKIVQGTTTVVPTRTKRPSGSNCESQSVIQAERNHSGMMDILEFAGKESGIDELIYQNTDRGTAEKIISIARYLVATGGAALPGIETFELSHPLPYEEGITEEIYHQLFAQLGLRDESLVQSFFFGRAEALGDRATLAFDSTTVVTYSVEITDARISRNKEGTYSKTIKFIVFYSVETRAPVAFIKLPGNIADVSTIANALLQLQALELKHPELMMDNGYHSEKNLREMCDAGFKFIMPLDLNLKWVRPEIDLHRKDLETAASICACDPGWHGTCLCLRRVLDGGSKNRRIYLHIFFNEAKKAEEDRNLDKKISEVREMLEGGVEILDENQTKIASRFLNVSRRNGVVKTTVKETEYKDAKKYHGYMVLAANKENNANTCLEKYRTRGHIELFFEVMKEDTEGNRPRVWDADTLQGRMFVEFVALCYYEFLYQKLREIKAGLGVPPKEGKVNKEQLTREKKLRSWLENTSLTKILQWFDAIMTTAVSAPVRARRWSTEKIARDQLFLEKLGIAS